MSPRPFLMESLRALAVTGPDARSFLQSQLSSDLAEVTATHGQLSGWHDPKGRTLAFLRVLPAPDGFLLVMNAGLLEAVAKRMRMYVLRAKVTLAPAPAVCGVPDPGDAPQGVIAGLPMMPEPLSAACAAGVSLLRLPGRAGWLVVGEPARVGADPDAAAEAAWARAEIEAGLPEVYPETSGEFVAQMLNLDRLGGISFTKGCYPGQEIVARAHHLGRVKRRARGFQAAAPPPPPGTSLLDSAGTVLRAAPAGGGCVLLAVVAEDSSGPFFLSEGPMLNPLQA